MLTSLLKYLFRSRARVPASAEASLGEALDHAIAAWRQGDLPGAETGLRAVLRDQPRHAAALANLGMVLCERQRHPEGLAMLRQAVLIDPRMAGAHCNLGIALAQGGLLEEARQHLEEALRLEPRDGLYANLLPIWQQLCDWPALERFVSELRALAAQSPAAAWAARLSPYAATLLPLGRAMNRAVADFHAARMRAAHPPLDPSLRASRPAGGKLRIGYLSADFHDHATAHLAVGLFAAHDKSLFEVTGYSYGPFDDGEYRRRIVAGCDAFVDVSRLSFRAAARRIAEDGIDILVDLKGHTGGGRPEILAYRPAPILVNFLGCPGTLGVGLADYFITDPVATPVGGEAEFSEQLVYLPASYQVNDALYALPNSPERAALGLPETAFVYCCFNQLYKIEPEIFSAWTRILREVPDAVLWLLGGNAYAEARLRSGLEAAGVGRERVLFAPGKPRNEHLARMRHAGLFLDTHYVNAHTSASDALRAGVPLLTWPAEHFASRVGASLATSAGLAELVVADADAYVDLAVRLAREPHRLAALRARLDERAGTTLFNTQAYARNLEQAYHAMQQRHRRGLPAAAIRIDPA